MTNRVDALMSQIHALEHDLAAEISRQRSGWSMVGPGSRKRRSAGSRNAAPTC